MAAATIAVPADHDLLPATVVAVADLFPANDGGAGLPVASVLVSLPIMAMPFPMAVSFPVAISLRLAGSVDLDEASRCGKSGRVICRRGRCWRRGDNGGAGQSNRGHKRDQ